MVCDCMDLEINLMDTRIEFSFLMSGTYISQLARLYSTIAVIPNICLNP